MQKLRKVKKLTKLSSLSYLKSKETEEPACEIKDVIANSKDIIFSLVVTETFLENYFVPIK